MNWPAQCSDVYAQKRWKSSFSRKLRTVRRQFLAGRLGAAIVLAGSDDTLDQGRGPDRALRIFSNVLVTARHAPSKLGEPYRSSPTFLSDVLLSSRSYSYFVVTLRRANRPSASCVAPTVSFHLPSASTTVTAGKADSSFSRQERTRSASGPGANSSSTQPFGSSSWLVCAREDSAAHRLTSTTTHNKPRPTLITASSPFPSEFEISGRYQASSGTPDEASVSPIDNSVILFNTTITEKTKTFSFLWPLSTGTENEQRAGAIGFARK